MYFSTILFFAVSQHDCTVNMQLPEGEGPEGVLSIDQPPVLADQAR